MTRSLRAAIVGCGAIAGGFDEGSRSRAIRTHAAAYRSRGVPLVAAVDLSPAKARRFARRWGAGLWYSSLAKMLSELRPDIVSVCTPDARHADIVAACAEAGVRAVWCEKPLDADLAKAERAAALCRAKGTLLTVNYLRRWLAEARELKAAISRGAFGPALTLHGTYCKGLLHNGSHSVDLLRFWLGEPTRSAVTGRAPCRGADPALSVRLEFGRQAVAYLTALGDPGYSLWEMDLIGPLRRARLTGGGYFLEEWSSVSNPDFPGYRTLKSLRPPSGTALDEAMGLELDEILRAVRRGERHGTGEDALKTLRLCCGLASSAAPGWTA